MTRYNMYNITVNIYLLLGIFSIAFVDAHPLLLILTFTCFLGAMGYHDLANKEWTSIKDAASMDRPE